MIRFAMLLCLVACAGRQDGFIEVGRFQGADGQVVVVNRAETADVYVLAAPGTDLAPVPIRRMNGLAEVSVRQAFVANGQAVVLLSGRAPGCAERTVFLATKFPAITSHILSGCDRSFELESHRNGRDLILRQSGPAASAITYTYRNGELFGTAPRRRAAAGPVHRAGPEASPRRQDKAARAGINLDEEAP